jgi:hypothetical protein
MDGNNKIQNIILEEETGLGESYTVYYGTLDKPGTNLQPVATCVLAVMH